MEGSEFETLEALAALMAHTIMSEFCKEGIRRFKGEDGWQLSISLEKPTAVTFAEGPVVQIRAGGGLVADVPVHTLTRLLLVQKFVARPLKILSSDHDLSSRFLRSRGLEAAVLGGSKETRAA